MENEPLIGPDARMELERLYGAADRHYHGMAHIRALLALAREHRSLLSDPEAVEAAIWYHDAVYDSRAKDNEALSAAMAADRLAGRVEPARLARIVAMIEATATHTIPALDAPEAQRDAALLLDMDLSILGAPADVFDAYEQAIRREFAWVDEPLWRAGRGAVLKTFLDRPAIFHTPELSARFEAQARANIARSLTALQG